MCEAFEGIKAEGIKEGWDKGIKEGMGNIKPKS